MQNIYFVPDNANCFNEIRHVIIVSADICWLRPWNSLANQVPMDKVLPYILISLNFIMIYVTLHK